jgi:hypothetical protein
VWQTIPPSLEEGRLTAVPWRDLIQTIFAQYRGSVFSNRNAPGSAELRAEMDLSLEELREQGQARKIFPPCAFRRAPERASEGMYTASVMYLRSQSGCLCGHKIDKIVSMADLSCDPKTLLNSDSRALGPFKLSTRV